MELELRSEEVQGAHEIGGRALRGVVSWIAHEPPGLDSFAKNSY